MRHNAELTGYCGCLQSRKYPQVLESREATCGVAGQEAFGYRTRWTSHVVIPVAAYLRSGAHCQEGSGGALRTCRIIRNFDSRLSFGYRISVCEPDQRVGHNTWSESFLSVHRPCRVFARGRLASRGSRAWTSLCFFPLPNSANGFVYTPVPSLSTISAHMRATRDTLGHNVSGRSGQD